MLLTFHTGLFGPSNTNRLEMHEEFLLDLLFTEVPESFITRIYPSLSLQCEAYGLSYT